MPVFQPSTDKTNVCLYYNTGAPNYSLQLTSGP